MANKNFANPEADSPAVPLVDRLGREMGDLRISVTDRCNLRCLYCLPETEEAANFYRDKSQNVASEPIPYNWKPKSQILTFDEIERVTRVFASLGVTKLRLTGGEPLLRRDFASLLSQLSAIPGIEDIAMTTNGFRFRDYGRQLKEAGLSRISFSLDALDAELFETVTGRPGLQQTLDAIEFAKELDLHPIKVNAVIIRDLNESQILPLIEYAQAAGVILRFIEFMPLDSRRGWMRDLVVSKRELLDRINAGFPIEPILERRPSETATRWRLRDTGAEFGIIAPVTEPFCGACNRIRLTVDGQLRTCLFSLNEFDLKPLIREEASDERLIEGIRERVWWKEKGHNIGAPNYVQPERTMSGIGG